MFDPLRNDPRFQKLARVARAEIKHVGRVYKRDQLEIAHVSVPIDIVGYSKLSVNEQHARVDELNGIVRLSEQFQRLKRPIGS